MRAIKLEIWRKDASLSDFLRYVTFLEWTKKILSPVNIQDHARIRLGNKNDGGYVLLDDYQHTLISIGIGRDTSFDHEFCKAKQRVFQFDHTIEAAPKCCENPNFLKLGLRATNSEQDSKLLTLQEIVSICIGDQSLSAILKIDIEGDEIKVLEEVDSEKLIKQFRQIVVEIHNLEMSYEELQRSRYQRVFTSLTKHFFIVNYHANNFTKLLVEGNVVVPSTFELTLANKELYSQEDSEYVYDKLINRANNPKFLDTNLHLSSSYND